MLCRRNSVEVPRKLPLWGGEGRKKQIGSAVKKKTIANMPKERENIPFFRERDYTEKSNKVHRYTKVSPNEHWGKGTQVTREGYRRIEKRKP